MTDAEWELARWKLAFARLDGWLDTHASARHLERPELAEVVMNALMYFAGQRCDVYAFVIMPSHFHWVFCPRREWTNIPADMTPRQHLMQSVKRFTGRRSNERLGRRGRFWQGESYDHWVRDEDELERIIRYVEQNPVKAGLCDKSENWPYSSARWRVETSSLPGRPLIPRRA